MLLVFVVLLGWTMVLLLQLPGNFQIFMFAFTSFIFGLFLYYWKKKPVISWRSPSVHRRLLAIAGAVLLVPSFTLFIMFVSIVDDLGLFVGWLSMLPASLGLLVGFQLVRGKRLKDAVLAWLVLDAIMLYPFLVVLPTAFSMPIAYQIVVEALIIVLTVVAFVVGVHSYRKRYSRRMLKQVARAW